MHDKHASVNEPEVVRDGNYEIRVTPELRSRFDRIRERNRNAPSALEKGLDRNSQFEMYDKCEYKESNVMELIHYLTRTQGVMVEDVCERIRMFSPITRGLCVRIISDQSRRRKQSSGKKTAEVKELASAK